MYSCVAMAYREVFLLVAQLGRFESLLLLYNYTKTVSVILCPLRFDGVLLLNRLNITYKTRLDSDRQLAGDGTCREYQNDVIINVI